MTRKEIEEYIVNGLTDKLAKHDFVLSEVSYKGERYAEYEYKKGEAIYKWTIIFKKYGGISVSLLIYYVPISKLYKQLSKVINDGNNFVFSDRMNTYLHPKNADGYHNTSDYLDSLYRKEISEGKNLNDVVGYIYLTYFVDGVPKLIAQTDTLEKANDIINDIPIKYKENGKPKMLIISTSFVDQILNGILTAQAINSPKYEEIRNEYLKYAEKFEPGRIVEIDLMREAIEKYSHS